MASSSNRCGAHRLCPCKTNIAFVGNNGHLHDEIDLAGSEGFERHESRYTKPQLIPLSSTFGHGVSVLASGRLPYWGYATGHSFLASVDGSRWSSLASSCLRLTYSLPQRASSTSSHHIRIVFGMEAREGLDIEDRAGRLVATTGHFFEDMMATCNHLDIAGRVVGKSSYTQPRRSSSTSSSLLERNIGTRRTRTRPRQGSCHSQ